MLLTINGILGFRTRLGMARNNSRYSRLPGPLWALTYLVPVGMGHLKVRSAEDRRYNLALRLFGFILLENCCCGNGAKPRGTAVLV